MDRLDRLENDSVYIIREAFASFERLSMLWSIGKDSTVLLHLCRKAFFGSVPFPLIHIDTSFKIPEMIAFRDALVRRYGLTLFVAQNTEALQEQQTFPAGRLTRLQCCERLKTQPFLEAMSGIRELKRLDLKTGSLVPEPSQPFDSVLLGIRCDEEGTRSKERVFSPRTTTGSWALGEQPPELWGYYNCLPLNGAHTRVHPLLDWTELDVWEYIEREQIEVTSLYFDRGNGTRYRSLGCECCTNAITSPSRTALEIVNELSTGALAGVPERAGRSQDKEDAGGLETLRKKGYM